MIRSSIYHREITNVLTIANTYIFRSITFFFKAVTIHGKGCESRKMANQGRKSLRYLVDTRLI
jgi:hypothetical protein